MAGRKKEKMTDMIKEPAEITLTGSPALPSDHGPNSMFSPFIRLIVISPMGVKYDMKRPAMISETMALKAAVEPMLMRPITAEMKVQKKIDRSGSAVRLSTRRMKSQKAEIFLGIVDAHT